MNKNKKVMERLLKHKGAVVGTKNIHASIIDSPSPSLNFTFGNAHGLPRGYSLLLYGPPKAGKSVICNAMAGKFQQDNPESWVVKYNTEFRESGQTGQVQQNLWGIDSDRYMAYETNTPDGVFDHIEKDLAALSQEGTDLGLVIIDSVTGIQGRRGLNAESVLVQQIGDNAATVQEGLKRILPIQRQCNFALIVTAHIRAQIDLAEIMRGNKIRPAVSFGTQHHAEYFMFVEPNRTKDGRVDLLGNEFTDDSVKDFQDKSEKTGHKVRVKMVDSSMGPKGRNAEFTFDYNKGIININEEIFLLGINRDIIQRPNNVMYTFDGLEWKGKEAMLNAIKDDKQLAAKILQELKKRDIAGMFKDEPEVSPS